MMSTEKTINYIGHRVEKSIHSTVVYCVSFVFKKQK
jgi:hypothetical protein